MNLFSSYYYYAVLITRCSLSLCPSVSLSTPTINLKTENRITFNHRADVAHVKSNWQSDFEGGPLIVSALLLLLLSASLYVSKRGAY